MPRWGKTTTAKLYGGSIHFRLSDPGTDEWVKALEGVKGKAQNLQPFFDRFGRYMLEGSIPRNFAAGGRPDRWPPLTPAYQKRKLAKWGNRPILVASGKMQQGFVYEATKRTLRIRNRMPYFDIHQRGGGHVPQRIMLLMQRGDKSVAGKFLKRHLYDSLEALR